MRLHRLQLILLFIFPVFFLVQSCTHDSEQEPVIFESLTSEETNIDFENNLISDPDFNVYKYRNFYNGAGVAVGDINQDGLPDIYLIGNSSHNKLYINQSDFTFEDVTEQAGVEGGKPWSTGAAFADINGDGLLDIYVTNSGQFDIDQRRNELFINNGDGTFTESAAEFGLDDPGYSIHASFFDYDLDGDLDMYLLNNSDASIIEYDLEKNHRNIRDDHGGDKLFRNDNGIFSDVSEEAGIYGSEIGFSLSASIGDVNRDGFPDIYVANDFFEYDYLYINNGDGTFSEQLKNQMNSISAASMGSDIADINNDGWPDIYVSDMLPESDQRTKLITTYENWERFSQKNSLGYHYQLTRNTLQLNNGNNTFSEISRLTKTQASDWSWAVLIADFDLNGHNDLLVTNGLYQDITNLDYIEDINNPDVLRSIISDDNLDFKELIDLIPSHPVPNVLFANFGDLKFKDMADAWGLGEPGYSSGAAWADLDGDGDLDLIINDVNGTVKIYRNQSTDHYPERSHLSVRLQGLSDNTQAIGAQLEIWADSLYWYREHYLQRGFQSSVEPGLHVGLGDSQTIDSLKLRWPDGSLSILYNIETPANIHLDQQDSQMPVTQVIYNHPAVLPGDLTELNEESIPLLTEITHEIELNWKHQKYDYIDFNRENLLLHMRSTEGPALCAGDLNGDGLDDFFIGGAREQSGILVLQDPSKRFIKLELPAFQLDADSEDTDCTFFDANGDQHLDLYVTSGGNSYSTGSSALFDRLYINDGTGNFDKAEDFISPGGFASNSTVTAADFTGNGATDLFIGERLKLFSVGLPARGFLLMNDGKGNFTDVSMDWNSEFSGLGMITDSEAIDWDGDGLQDLAVTGEWMTPRIFRNTGSSFKEITNDLNLSDKRGLWNSIYTADIDQDGRTDLVLGNHGLNSHLQTNKDDPLKMWIGDFQNNGITDQLISRSFNQNDYPFVLRHDLLNQIPSLRAEYPDYASYADQTIQDIFTEQQLERMITLQSDLLESIVVYNKTDGTEIENLPARAQLSPVFGIWSGEIIKPGKSDFITSGNLIEVKPMAGSYDAGYGTVSTFDENQIKSIPATLSGLSVRGSGRGIISINDAEGNEIIIIARNNDSPVFYKVNSP